jgi:arginyl-tRNA--protein-N-Asp/Glu arginylyltransferase
MALKQHTANFTEKYEQLYVNYEQLRHMVMNMTSQSGDTYPPLFGHITTSLLLLLQLCHCANLIFF